MDQLLLYFFSAVLVVCSLKTITSKHPAYGALYLASSMVCMAGIFYLLGARFIAGLQLIIYAGAVIVLFVMVIMLFEHKDHKDLKKSIGLHWGLPVFLFGLVAGVIALMSLSSPLQNQTKSSELFSAKQTALQLFTEHLFLFELLGFLLLLVAIGVVMLIRLDKES